MTHSNSQKGGWAAKIITVLFLLGLAAAGVALVGLLVPSPWHYTGALLPLLVVYLLGSLAEKKS